MNTTMRNLKIKNNNTDLKQIFRVKDKIIGCDGGEDYGHPLVYINLTKGGRHVCPYCSKIYILKK